MEGDKSKAGIIQKKEVESVVDVGGGCSDNNKYKEEKVISEERSKQRKEEEEEELFFKNAPNAKNHPPPPPTAVVDRDKCFYSFCDGINLQLPSFDSLTSSYADQIDLPNNRRRKECPICMLPIPSCPTRSIYRSCCGQVICGGCEMKYARSAAIEHVKKSFAKVLQENNGGSVPDKKKFESTLLDSETYPHLANCAFCRTDLDTQNMIKRLENRIDNYNDEIAMTQLGIYYMDGSCGVTKDVDKGIDLLMKAGYELGDPKALCYIAECYHDGSDGFEKDLNKAVALLLLALIHKGHPYASMKLIKIFLECNLIDAVMFSARIASRFGYMEANDIIMHGYKEGWVSKEECTKSLREYQKAKSEMESPERIEYELHQKEPLISRTKQFMEMAKLIGDLKVGAEGGGQQQQRGVDRSGMNNKGAATNVSKK